MAATQCAQPAAEQVRRGRPLRPRPARRCTSSRPTTWRSSGLEYNAERRPRVADELTGRASRRCAQSTVSAPRVEADLPPPPPRCSRLARPPVASRTRTQSRLNRARRRLEPLPTRPLSSTARPHLDPLAAPPAAPRPPRPEPVRRSRLAHLFKELVMPARGVATRRPDHRRRPVLDMGEISPYAHLDPQRSAHTGPEALLSASRTCSRCTCSSCDG